MSLSAKQFQTRLLKWFDQHGRKHLPWQKKKNPYRVWISEIMLQQTQVSTVISYYERFMQQFPTITALAHAHEDEVLHLWAGLGYYSRARNLHRAAKQIIDEFDGRFPNNLEDIQQLPGIGRSTAGAILSIAFNQRAAILDGNVKRVLARFYGITDPINDKATETELWALAETLAPTTRTADYSQAMMDLGATLCVRSKPQCTACPFVKNCIAHTQGIAASLPRKKATKKIPVRTATFLILRKKGNTILLQKRPPVGIWGGLWSLPQLNGEPDELAINDFCRNQYPCTIKRMQSLTPFRHTFTHYHLDIFPILLDIQSIPMIMEDKQQMWYNHAQPESVGLPKPVQSILRMLP